MMEMIEMLEMEVLEMEMMEIMEMMGMMQVMDMMEVMREMDIMRFCLSYLPMYSTQSPFLNEGDNPDCYHHGVAEELSPNALSVPLPQPLCISFPIPT